MNKNSYYKRMEKTKLLQIWLKSEAEDHVKLIPYKCERKYYGEGLKKEDLIEIDIKEFTDLGWLFDCFKKDEDEILIPSNSSTSL
jgi:hypothetical protein